MERTTYAEANRRGRLPRGALIGALTVCISTATTRGLAAETGTLTITASDRATAKPVPARLYIAGSDGNYHLPARPPDGSVAMYDRNEAGFGVRETYAAVSRWPVSVELPSGDYVLTVERGKEYIPQTRRITLVANKTAREDFRLARVVDMASRGWYSGDCHVHTSPADLPVAQLADDINVTFPISAWAHSDDEVPSNNGPGGVPSAGRAVPIDERHLYWNLNTEYEIARLRGQDILMGAVLILGHTRPLQLKAPPIRLLAEEARRQGAVLDWEKHTWPWSTMLVPVAGIDTIELSNNSMWRQRTIHAYLWGRTPPPWIPQPLDARGFVDYGFETWYALLNCGYFLRPSAGTANGVHAVPLGHSRVYVKLDGPFSYEKWMAGFRAGHSFTTNGPLLTLNVNGIMPGDRATLHSTEKRRLIASIEAWSAGSLDRIEIVVNGKVARAFEIAEPQRDAIMHHARVEAGIDIDRTSWVAVRCFDRSTPDKIRFAHTAPVFFDDPARPLLPERRQIDYLIDSVSSQLDRYKGRLPEAVKAEFEQSLEAYRKVAGKLPRDPR